MGQNQGEGDRESAKKYDKDQHEFVESGSVEKDEAHRRTQVSDEEKEDMQKAEETGKSHAKK